MASAHAGATTLRHTASTPRVCGSSAASQRHQSTRADGDTAPAATRASGSQCASHRVDTSASTASGTICRVATQAWRHTHHIVTPASASVATAGPAARRTRRLARHVVTSVSCGHSSTPRLCVRAASTSAPGGGGGDATSDASDAVFTSSQIEAMRADGRAVLAIHGSVYDVTEFLREHPGGGQVRAVTGCGTAVAVLGAAAAWVVLGMSP